MTTQVDLDVQGMTCASCASRIEKKLNRVPGVQASVNFATHTAHLVLPVDVTAAQAISVVSAAGYSASLARDESSDARRLAMLRLRLIVSACLTLPLIALMFIDWGNSGWISFALATPVALWGAWPFHAAAVANARHRSSTMDTLISIGVLAAYSWSVAILLDGAGDHLYFEVAATVTTFVLLGRWIEARATRRSGDALRALISLGAKEVEVWRDGAWQRVAVDTLAVNEEFRVRPGEKVATDGVVVEGVSAINAALVTGESLPIDVGPGSHLIGATLNTDGLLRVRATRVGADTQLAAMGRLLNAAQSGKAPAQRLADRVSAVFVPIVLGLAALTFAGWMLLGFPAAQALSAAIAVLVIACPCALGLATPTALLAGTGRGAQLGILMRGPEVLEASRAVDTVVLDKTGTITTGRMSVVGVYPVAAVDLTVPEADPSAPARPSEQSPSRQLLELAAAVEVGSHHPVALAIVSAARSSVEGVTDSSVNSTALEEFSSVPGLGVRGVIDDAEVVVGRISWVLDQLGDAAVPTELEAHVGQALERGHTLVAVAVQSRFAGVIAVGDSVATSSADAVLALRNMGIRVLMVTGDNSSAAAAVAQLVAVDEVRAEVLPAGKVDVISELQTAGRVVAMVGDGVNDAAALAAADLGIAMGSGTDVAREASDITIMRDDLGAVVDALRLSRRTSWTIRTNLVWAFGYNVAAIPLAMSGLLTPIVASAAMALSSICVVLNSLRLSAFRR